jgi:hypothetical protein
MPLKPRRRPPVLPDMAGSPSQSATCYIGDVYSGLEGTPRGAVKYIRIAQRVGWPLDDKIGAARYIPGNAWEKQFGYWAWAPVRVIGTVPVEEDGSACFQVPADEAVYFQVLDEDFMELRRMRSHVTFQGGETRGCLGCHESKPRTPHTSWITSLALGREPVIPEPPSWGADRLLGYEWLIQPILDRHCTECHNPSKPDGGIDLSSTRGEDGFCQSFRTLFGDRVGTEQPGPMLVSVSNRFDGSAVSQPRQFGSHRSRLIQLLREDELHTKEVRLDDQAWRALVTWIDANAPYHDSFYNRRPTDGSKPVRNVAVNVSFLSTAEK